MGRLEQRRRFSASKLYGAEHCSDSNADRDAYSNTHEYTYANANTYAEAITNSDAVRAVAEREVQETLTVCSAAW